MVTTACLPASRLRAIRALLDEAFAADADRFDDLDWEHALGGTHVLAEAEGRIVAHAAIVHRTLHVAGTPLRTGYVEAVATVTARQGAGIGSMVMDEVGRLIRERFELGALGTGRHAFYARLGWETWRGPSFVRTGDSLEPTPDDDGSIMVLRTPSTPRLDLDAAITSDWRAGDVW